MTDRVTSQTVFNTTLYLLAVRFAFGVWRLAFRAFLFHQKVGSSLFSLFCLTIVSFLGRFRWVYFVRTVFMFSADSPCTSDTDGGEEEEERRREQEEGRGG
jgi:hypothetical protein